VSGACGEYILEMGPFCDNESASCSFREEGICTASYSSRDDEFTIVLVDPNDFFVKKRLESDERISVAFVSTMFNPSYTQCHQNQKDQSAYAYRQSNQLAH
jgi:hypothetical protein